MTDNTKDLQLVRDRLAERRPLAQQMAGQAEKRLRWALGIKVVLLAFIFIYMGWIYASLRTVDADFLVIAGQQRFHESLPSVKAAMVDWLTKMAPSFVNQAGNEVLRGVPKMEAQFETLGKNTILKVSGTLEKNLTAWLSSLIHDTKGEMGKLFPGMSSYEQLTRYRSHILHDFQDGIEVIIFQMHRFMAKEGLINKEKLQRDIIAIWYLVLQNQIAEHADQV